MSFGKLLMPVLAATAVAVTGFAAAPAQAAGPWQGFYAGAQVGYGWSEDSLHEKLFGGADGFDRSWNTDGVVGGGFAGYNLQFDRIVAGLESDFGGADLGGGFTTPYGGSARQNYKWTASVRPRAGYLVTPQLLLYGTAGIAMAQIRDEATFTNGVMAINQDPVRFGWTAGGGAEYNVWHNWNVRAEYRYSDYGSPTLSSASSYPFGERVSATTNTLQLGVSYKFF